LTIGHNPKETIIYCSRVVEWAWRQKVAGRELLLSLPVAVLAQFQFATNGGEITKTSLDYCPGDAGAPRKNPAEII
jgi:hypothetical protein